MDIEKEIADIFKKLVKEKFNASFAYSFVYTDEKEMAAAKIKGRLNIHGSVEEIKVHVESIQRLIKEETDKKKKHYATNRKNTEGKD